MVKANQRNNNRSRKSTITFVVAKFKLFAMMSTCFMLNKEISMRKILIMFYLSVLLAPMIGSAFQENDNTYSHHNIENKFEKIYLEPEQVIISKEGLFINVYNAVFKIPKLHSDVAGIYVLANYLKVNKRCDNGHIIYCQCGGCCNRICKFRCRCKE